MIRLFVADALAEGGTIEPRPDQARYLTAVMRQAAGDEVLLFNGRDGEWRARIAEVSKRGCTLSLGAMTRPQQSPAELELVVALVKRARLEIIVEKAAELGVSRVRLLLTRRTNADHTNVARLQAIAVEASEQTGRLDVPEIVPPEKLDRLLDGWDERRKLMFCDEAGDDPNAEWGGAEGRARPALAALLSTNDAKNAAQHEVQQNGDVAAQHNRSGAQHEPQHFLPGAILIGPEGGFDPEERARLRSLHFVVPVTLGPRILRADTAAIAALTLWQAALGDWR